MKRTHFEALRPVCPRCRAEGRTAAVDLVDVTLGESDDVLQGRLVCSDPACSQEYPILDGIPIIVPDVRSYVADHHPHLLQRDDLSPLVESLIGDCCGPGALFNATREHLSSYASSHYGDLDPQGGAADGNSMLDLLAKGIELAGDVPEGAAVDVGCAVGRSTFALAERRKGLVLGVDLSFSMLRVAATVLREGVVRYPRRRVGLVYERREFSVSLAGAERVDFWCCDALALPFGDASFALASSLNVLDCVSSPRDHLVNLAQVLAPGGKALIATPYDWSPGATPVESWLGGHSQRGEPGGSSEETLRALLTDGAHPAFVPGLRITAEASDVPWSVRIHDRHTAKFSVHLAVAESV